jgi:hypothetical protein
MRILIMALGLIFAGTAMADKPEWAGKGKPTEEQKASHRAAMEAKADEMDDDALDEGEKRLKKAKLQKSDKEQSAREKLEKSGDDHGQEAAMNKQRMKKAEQERKSESQGSEKGQAQREEKSRAWWRFWED